MGADEARIIGTNQSKPAASGIQGGEWSAGMIDLGMDHQGS